MGNKGINPSSKVADGLLNELTLRVSCTEERKIRQQKNPASLGKGQSGEHQTKHEQDFQASDETHAGIVILLDKPTDRISQRGPWSDRLRRTRRARRARPIVLSRLEGRNQVRSSVSRNMEDRVHSEWKKRQWDLARVEPHKGHP